MADSPRISAIKMAAFLLANEPSTDADDHPEVPAYYLEIIRNFIDTTRAASSTLRDAHGECKRLEESNEVAGGES